MSEEEMNDEKIIQCPHCHKYIIMIKLNCGIFRHGILKIDYKQIDPHCSKEQCDNYIENNLIFGCGKPFRVIMDGTEYKIEICDYI